MPGDTDQVIVMKVLSQFKHGKKVKNCIKIKKTKLEKMNNSNFLKFHEQLLKISKSKKYDLKKVVGIINSIEENKGYISQVLLAWMYFKLGRVKHSEYLLDQLQFLGPVQLNFNINFYSINYQEKEKWENLLVSLVKELKSSIDPNIYNGFILYSYNYMTEKSNSSYQKLILEEFDSISDFSRSYIKEKISEVNDGILRPFNWLSLINTKFDYESYHHYLNEYLKLKNINNLKNLELSLYYVQKNPYSIFFSKKTYPKNNKDLFFKFVNNQMFLMKVDNPYLKKKSFQEHRKAIIKLVNSNPRQWSFLYQLFAIGDIDVKYIK